MRLKKMLFIFIALLLPVCVFVFLKFFGKNEFAVPPLYAETNPENIKECGVTISLPYHINDSIMSSLSLANENLTLIHFGGLSTGATKQLDKVQREYANDIKFKYLDSSDTMASLKKCVFFLRDTYDLALIDGDGVIRGEYIAADREEIDRLRMELSILLKRY